MDSSADVSPAPADRPRRTADPANATVLAHASTAIRNAIRIAVTVTFVVGGDTSMPLRLRSQSREASELS